MPARKLPSVSPSARLLTLRACLVGAILAPTARAEQPANQDARWVQSSPQKVVWSSEGSANVLGDHSIELRGSSDWQEFTLYFQPPELAQIKRVLLEVLPSARSRDNRGQRLVLFDVKPDLESVKNGTTRLEFQRCRFLGNEADETAANCIDFLSDTGWTAPDFVGKDAGHQLVLELRKPVTVQRDNMLAITIDAGGAPDLKQLSRIRVSFSGANVAANHHQNAAIPAGTEDRSMLKGVPFEFRWCPPGRFLMGSPRGTESEYGDRFVQQHKVRLTRGYWMMATEVTQIGNVAGWCEDWHAPPAREDQTNPRGPGHGENRIVRGDDCFVCSTFLRGDGACMAGTRSSFPPSTASRVIGFRIVRVPRSDGGTMP